jgi:hypothetical protein
MAILTREAVAKLVQVRDAILAEPKLYDQSTFGNPHNPCRSACCLAGWVMWFDDPDKFKATVKTSWHSVSVWARRILGVETGDGELWRRGLFCDGEDWPEPFGSQFGKASSRADKARIAAAYIDYIIAQDGPK